MIGPMVLLLFIACATYVQMRGNVRHSRVSRLLTDHSNFLAPLNCLFYASSTVPSTPYVGTEHFPELEPLQREWKTIRDEALGLERAAQIKASVDLDDAGFNSFFRTGWKRFYLKWYREPPASAKTLCPKTVALLESIPSVRGAMFAMLPPGAKLVRHRDPFAGSLRYHLGLATPNSDDCFIEVDGIRHSWRDGEAVLFDETYLHYARNDTQDNRIILFLDVKRPTRFGLIDTINDQFSRLVVSASATKNSDGDEVGWLSRSFRHAYAVRRVGKRIKVFSRPLYYGLQILLYALIIRLVFF